jgi:hypothetical protein
MNSIVESLLGILQEYLEKSPARVTTQHYAILFPHNTPIAENCVIAENSDYKETDWRPISTHAEVAALKKHEARNLKSKKMDLMVVRVSKTGKLGMSRPCTNCIKSMCSSDVQIVTIYYSTEAGEIAREKFHEMKNIQTSYISTAFRRRLGKASSGSDSSSSERSPSSSPSNSSKSANNFKFTGRSSAVKKRKTAHAYPGKSFANARFRQQGSNE